MIKKTMLCILETQNKLKSWTKTTKSSLNYQIYSKGEDKDSG